MLSKKNTFNWLFVVYIFFLNQHIHILNSSQHLPASSLNSIYISDFSAEMSRERSNRSDISANRSHQNYNPIPQYHWDFDEKEKPEKSSIFYTDTSDYREAIKFYEKWNGQEREMFDQIKQLLPTQWPAIFQTIQRGHIQLAETDLERKANVKKELEWFENVQKTFRPIQLKFQLKYLEYHDQKNKSYQKELKLKKKAEEKQKKKESSVFSSVKGAFTSLKAFFSSSSPSIQKDVKSNEQQKGNKK